MDASCLVPILQCNNNNSAKAKIQLTLPLAVHKKGNVLLNNNKPVFQVRLLCEPHLPGRLAFRQCLKDLPYYFRILRFLPQIEFDDNHLIQLAIKRVKGLILTHFELLELSGQHLQLGVFHFLHSFIGGSQYLPWFFGNGNVRNLVKLIWINTIENFIQGFNVSISCHKGCFIPSGFSSLWPCLICLYGILNSIIN